jgi:hypothetical protein
MSKVAEMTREELISLIKQVVHETTHSAPLLPDDYDPAHDPTIGIVNIPSDLSNRVEDVLDAEFGIARGEVKK